MIVLGGVGGETLLAEQTNMLLAMQAYAINRGAKVRKKYQFCKWRAKLVGQRTKIVHRDSVHTMVLR